MYLDTRSCTQFSLCTVTILRLRPSLYRDTAPVHFSKHVTGDDNSTRYKNCTAIPPACDKTCTITPKTAPYPSRHRDSFPAKVPGQVPGWLRRVTQPPFIAVPLALITFQVYSWFVPVTFSTRLPLSCLWQSVLQATSRSYCHKPLTLRKLHFSYHDCFLPT
jgi:hypothetical protein